MSPHLSCSEIWNFSTWQLFFSTDIILVSVTNMRYGSDKILQHWPDGYVSPMLSRHLGGIPFQTKELNFQLLILRSGWFWPRHRYFEVIIGTLRYLKVLKGTSMYFEVLLGTLRYLKVFLGTLRYLKVLWGTSWKITWIGGRGWLWPRHSHLFLCCSLQQWTPGWGIR